MFSFWIRLVRKPSLVSFSVLYKKIGRRGLSPKPQISKRNEI